mmetsp:Transcript_14976/g.23187  ORF Transcript_14976/g.23187 Transcript_14976/m.23187 type:complete len:95 (+) Transcript_14976:537-821(+)
MQGMTAIHNTDYSSCKAALTSFFDTLRQEVIDNGWCGQVSVTNVYPYIIDTSLFAGFSGLALKLIPTLKKEDVAARIVRAIENCEVEVYIPWFT